MKYQNDGGPSPADVIELLRTYSTDRVADVDTFVDALGFNWLIAGTDAHAKAQKDGLDNAIIGHLAKHLIARAGQCRRLLGEA
ncbi:hypothetical protein ABID58_007529 [Bradyrhizobium sp. S3.2.6]